MKMQVIVINSRPMRRNDNDDRWLLCRSRAHAMRVIRWLGLTGATVREATEEEVAEGVYGRVHETPDWSTATPPLPVPAGVATLS